MRMNKYLIIGGGLAVTIAAGGTIAAAQAGDEPPPKAQGRVLLQENAAGEVPVGDREGVARGTVNLEDMDKVSDLAGAFLAEHELTLVPDRDGRLTIDKDVSALSDAVMVIEAIPVHGPDGTTVGRFGSGFIEEDEYPAMRKSAEATLAKATGEPYRSR